MLPSSPQHGMAFSALPERMPSTTFSFLFLVRVLCMHIRDGLVDAIGNTPLIKLERASALTGCTILGKAEFINPGQSVKDRAGKWMILEAEKRGELKPGGLVVEATAGNTGIGLARRRQCARLSDDHRHS